MIETGVFISHSWTYSQHYDKLAEWIFEMPWELGQDPVSFYDVSVPKDNPIHNAPNADALRSAIYERIQFAHVVVIPTGMYASYSEWIQKEIEGARLYGKPILAVNPWAQEKKSAVVTEAANKLVGWSANSVINGIWHLRNGS